MISGAILVAAISGTLGGLGLALVADGFSRRPILAPANVLRGVGGVLLAQGIVLAGVLAAVA